MQQSLKTLCWLLLGLPVWVACSAAPTDDTTVATAIALPTTVTSVDLTGDVTTNAPIIGSDQQLSETYTGENMLVNASLTVNYPAGWSIRGLGTQLLLANQDPDTITADSEAIVINIVPVEGEMLDQFSDLTPDGILAQAMLDTVGQVIDIETTLINDREAAVAMAALDGNPARIYALQFDTTVFVILQAIKAQGFSDEEASLIDEIASQISYDAGAIPNSE